MNLNDLSKDAIMFLIVGAVILFAGYELIHRPDGDAAKLLLGAIIGCFALVTNRLFGPPPSS